MDHDFQHDLDAVARIPAISAILEVVCRTTGMGFAAVARVTEDRWICCAVRKSIPFPLEPGGELEIGSTICNEIRAHGRPVVIDHVQENSDFHGHPTPARYGFQSYISMPITLPDGRFFGTLCAIDPAPRKLENPETIGMFKLFAELIAFHLDLQQRLTASEEANRHLQDRFRAGLGHDMRNTLTAMEAGTRLLLKTPLNERAQLVAAEMQGSIGRLSGQIAQAMTPPPAN